LPEGVALPEGGLLNGFVDLVFKVGGRFFLADWKTNYLTDAQGEEDYSASRIREAMDEHGYHLQYRLYTAAVAAWLTQCLPGFDFDLHFGGVYYCFLRGMNEGEPGRGVFFASPAALKSCLSPETVKYHPHNGWFDKSPLKGGIKR
jgi:exodeoxyribonuclease V beta subunit